MKSRHDILLDITRAFETIYATPYQPNKSLTNDFSDLNSFSMDASFGEEEESPEEQWGIARLAHGISHTASTALMVRSLVNFRQNHGDQNCQLSENDIFYLQITALLHDSARQGDNEDLWDLASGEMCYHYLRTHYGLTPEKAKFYAEAIANKDMMDEYNELIVDEPDNIRWAPAKTSSFPKPIEWQILHDVDSLEIIRARDQFKGKLLDVAEWLMQTDNEEGLNELGMIYSEYKRFIRSRGDEYGNLNKETKLLYEQADCGLKILSLWEKEFPALNACYNNGEPLSRTLDLETEHLNTYLYTVEELSLRQKMKEAKILVRAIPVPSAEDEVKLSKNKNHKYPDKATLEIKKASREGLGYKGFRRIFLTDKQPSAEDLRPNNITLLLEDNMLTAFWVDEGKIKSHAYSEHMVADILDKLPEINSKSEDPGLLKAVCKQYKINLTAPKFNPIRSTSLATTYIGGQVFGGAGFLIEINDEQVLDVSKIDTDSGRGKKDFDFAKKLTPDEARNELNKLVKKQRLGEAIRVDSVDIKYKHSEINYDIHAGDYVAVYFCTESNSYTNLIEKKKSPHPLVTPLLAVYLQKQYEQLTGVRLPVYSYSTEGKPIKEKHFTKEDILTMWENLVTDYLRDEDPVFIEGIMNYYGGDIDQLLDQIKIHAVYGATRNQLSNNILSADSIYPEELKINLNDRLFRIVKNRNSTSIHKFNEKGQEIIHIAAERGHLELMKKIAAVNSIDDSEDKKFNSPLSYAIKGSYHDCIKFIIGEHKDWKDTDINGLTPLHAAAGYCTREEIIDEIIDNGMDINVHDSIYGSPLHIAILCENHVASNRLIERGADLRARNRKGQEPIHVAAETGDLDVFQFLLDSSIPHDTVTRKGETALHFAASKGHVDIVDCLLDFGVDVNTPTKKGKTALHYAAQADNVDVIDHLLIKGASPNLTTNDGETAVHFASLHLNLEILARLLAVPGVDLDKASNYFNMTPLHFAAQSGDSQKGLMAVKLLLEHGALPNVKEYNGLTPLHMALFNFEYEIVDALLAHGADPNMDDEKGNTVFHLAIERGCSIKHFKKLINACVTIEDKQNEQGKSILELAKIANYPEEIISLLENKIRQSSQKETAPETLRFFKPAPEKTASIFNPQHTNAQGIDTESIGPTDDESPGKPVF